MKETCRATTERLVQTMEVEALHVLVARGLLGKLVVSVQLPYPPPASHHLCNTSASMGELVALETIMLDAKGEYIRINICWQLL